MFRVKAQFTTFLYIGKNYIHAHIFMMLLLQFICLMRQFILLLLHLEGQNVG